VAQTALGAATLVIDKNDTAVQTLSNQVTSKGGTTEAGLKILSKHNFESIINQVVNAAKNRSKELSTKSE